MLTDSPLNGRGRRKQEQFEVVLDRALDLFAEHGPAGLTVRQLAGELGFSSGALYRYVASKDELLARVQMRAHEVVHARLRAAISGSADSDLDRLLAAARFYIELPTLLPREARLLQFLLGDPRPLLADGEAVRIVPSLAALLGDVAALFASAAHSGSLSPGEPRVRATCFWSALQGAQPLRKLARFDPDLFDCERASLETVTGLLLHWGADPAALTQALARHAGRVLP